MWKFNTIHKCNPWSSQGFGLSMPFEPARLAPLEIFTYIWYCLFRVAAPLPMTGVGTRESYEDHDTKTMIIRRPVGGFYISHCQSCLVHHQNQIAITNKSNMEGSFIRLVASHTTSEWIMYDLINTLHNGQVIRLFAILSSRAVDISGFYVSNQTMCMYIIEYQIVSGNVIYTYAIDLPFECSDMW